MKQYIYHLKRTDINKKVPKTVLEQTNNTHFTLIKASNSYKIFKYYGFSVTTLKQFLKLVLNKSMLYAVVCDGEIASDGQFNRGFCKYYAVGNKDVVIGPVNTSASHQGKGLATKALSLALTAISELDIERVFIDTSEHNLPMQKVIAKVGFGEHKDFFIRTNNKL